MLGDPVCPSGAVSRNEETVSRPVRERQTNSCATIVTRTVYPRPSLVLTSPGVMIHLSCTKLHFTLASTLASSQMRMSRRSSSTSYSTFANKCVAFHSSSNPIIFSGSV